MKKILILTTAVFALMSCSGGDSEENGKAANYMATIIANEAVLNGETLDVAIAISPEPQNASDISSIELFVDGKSEQTVFNLPYEFRYTPKDVVPGTYKLNAVVKFQDGRQITAEKDVNIKVKFGAEFQGGIVIFLEENELHGLISAKADLQDGVIGKYRYGNPAFDYQAYSRTDGYANTQKFIGKADDDYAATACLNSREGGYSDWYLPSVEEFKRLSDICDSHTAIPGLIPLEMLGTNLYWTSTLREDGVHAEVGWAGRVSFIMEDLEIRRLHYARCFRKF
jgi:hypothetical protein